MTQQPTRKKRVLKKVAKNPGYYIVARSGEQRAEIVGPFKTEQIAASKLEGVTDYIHRLFPTETPTATFSVERGEPSLGRPRVGTKNEVLGYWCDQNGWANSPSYVK